MLKYVKRHRYAICCVLSGLASLLGFVNPLLAGVFISGAMSSLSLTGITPFIAGMAFVNGTRIFLRNTVANLLKGRQRSPIIWLQHRIGKWLWWLEPALHGWGMPGIVLNKFGRWLKARKLTSPALEVGRDKPAVNKRYTLSIASSIIYLFADACVTALSGFLFYLTRSYTISLLAVLLPAAAAVPWFRKKSRRIKQIKLQGHNVV